MAEINTIFSGIFKVKGEGSPTLVADVFDSNDALVANKLVNKRSAGYLFQHVFTQEGVYTVRITDSQSVYHYDSVRVNTPADVWNTTEGIQVRSDLSHVRDMQSGRFKIDETNNTMTFYKEDNLTVIATYALKDINGLPTWQAPFERVKL